MTGCCCFERGVKLIGNTCPYVELCLPIIVFCPDEQQGDCPVEVIEVEDPEQLDCTLDALAGVAAGQLLWSITPAGGSGWVQSRSVYVVGDGTALMISGDFFGADSHMNDTVRVELAAPQYFIECKALPPAQAFDCLRKGLGAVTETCIAGYDFERNK